VLLRSSAVLEMLPEIIKCGQTLRVELCRPVPLYPFLWYVGGLEAAPMSEASMKLFLIRR